VLLVPQDDICTEDITVRENLFFNALLRLPRSMAYEKKEAIVEHVVKLVQLGRVEHSIVGSVEKRGISGGQRKRVNM
jgi:ABC-type multidrug transport system ATPase subunit